MSEQDPAQQNPGVKEGEETSNRNMPDEEIGFRVWGDTNLGYIGEEVFYKRQLVQFEPIHVRIWHQLPCTSENADEVYDKIHERLKAKLYARMNDIQGAVDAAKGNR